jgi:hypothetical protein
MERRVRCTIFFIKDDSRVATLDVLLTIATAESHLGTRVRILDGSGVVKVMIDGTGGVKVTRMLYRRFVSTGTVHVSRVYIVPVDNYVLRTTEYSQAP